MLQNLLSKFRSWRMSRRITAAQRAEAEYTARFVAKQMQSFEPIVPPHDGSRVTISGSLEEAVRMVAPEVDTSSAMIENAGQMTS